MGSGSSLKRIQLLQEAYEHAVEATALAPNSLSCAALRATLAINLLVEESALLNPSNKPAKKGQGVSALDKKCQELRERFKGSIDACRTALEHPSPVMVEPVITMITSTHTTRDPCSLVSCGLGFWPAATAAEASCGMHACHVRTMGCSRNSNCSWPARAYATATGRASQMLLIGFAAV